MKKILKLYGKSSDNSLLSIENLNYEYNGRDGFQLRNINFSINYKKIAITGKTDRKKHIILFNARFNKTNEWRSFL